MSEPSEGGVWRRLAAPLEGRTFRLTLALALIAATIAASAYAWRTWADPVVRGPRYTLTRENIEITPLPTWIRTDLLGQVVRHGSLEGQALLDPQLTIKVADAFRLHAWVREVRRVTKRYPTHVQVALEFRRPVALVQVETETARGVLPVDGDSVVLPREDFVDEQGQLIPEALKYPVIVAGDSIPEGQAGAPWGDGRVLAAARIAATFADDWSKCGLFKIAPAAPEDRATDDLEFVLLARNGSRVAWGPAPGDTPAEQTEAREKVERLLRFVANNEAFADGAAPVAVDLRAPGDLRVGPATAHLTP